MSDDDESVGGESDIWTEYGEEVTILLLELEANVREVFTITEQKTPTRAFSLLKAFTFKTLFKTLC